MSRPSYLRGYLARITAGGVLSMRDPNDRTKSRYEYCLIFGVPHRRRRRSRGEWRDHAAQWEPCASAPAGTPIGDYYLTQ